MDQETADRKFYEICLLNSSKMVGAPFDNWNYRYRLSLEANNLKLTQIMPNPLSYFVEAPWPTAQINGEKHTPETDKHAWNVPSWIVPIDWVE